jgi:two-component system OmpR family sensor kinase
MSSSDPRRSDERVATLGARLRRARVRPRLVRPRRWTLRARLLSMVAALLVSVSLAVGLVTVVALRGYLVHRLDVQLASAGGRSNVAGGGSHPGDDRSIGADDTGVDFLRAPGQAAGTLGARLVDAKIVKAGVLGENGAITELSAATVTALAGVPADGHPHTLGIGDRGQYRLVATRTQDGDVLVTGLPLRTVDTTVGRLILVELAVAGTALLLAMAAGWVIMRRTLRPLRRVASTATRVSQLQLERGEVALADRVPEPDTDPRTEVGQVGGALNRLLDHVTHALTARQASETRVRRFVADASHELRTPLASIRGYAELTRRSRNEVPPDIAYALERVESEAQRMTTMVEDLLLLARLDSGRPLAREPVDLTRLVIDAVSDAQAAGSDHQWQLDLPDEPVTVTGDAPSLHQVLTNLLANARTHTPPGTRVITSVASSQPGSVVITVLDDGPGVPADVLPTVFDRFTRGAESRTRTAASATSTGLGLSIVAAIVTAHHGTVHVTSHPGQTAFLVRLPTSAA